MRRWWRKADRSAGRREAELRRAAELGDAEAMVALADLISSGGPSREENEDERWYRSAAEVGHPRALAVITTRLRVRGEDVEAERWLRRAVEAIDVPFFLVELGELLAARGELDEAEYWYRRAADGGHVTAMSHLGSLLVATGRTGEAEQWYRLAAGFGSTSAMVDLALLLVHRGETAEAERRLAEASDARGVDVGGQLWAALPEPDAGELDLRERDAAEAGRHRVLVVLGVLAARRGDVDRAEHCFRRAADAGDAQAMYELGMLLTRWGGATTRARARGPHRPGRAVPSPSELPRPWFARAAELGHPDAVMALGKPT